jgi:hypothetical protein
MRKICFRRNPIEDLDHLLAYMNMTEDDQKLDLLYSQDWVIKNETSALEDVQNSPHVSDEIKSEVAQVLEDEDAYLADMTPEAIQAVVSILDPQQVLDYLHRSEVDEVPLWATARLLSPVVEAGWLVHSTDHGSEVYNEGFTKGCPDLQGLAYTKHGRTYSEPGYSFAYTADDFDRHGWEGERPRYGSDILLLQAPYIYIYHYGDEEPQAIFWGPDARKITWVSHVKGEYVLEDSTGEELFFDSISDLVDAIENEGGTARENPGKDYQYFGNCVSSTYEWIQDLRDNSVGVTWATFRRNIPDAREFFEEQGAFYPETTNKDIEGSPFISFNKGKHRGRPAYWADWSGYEWIWEAVG